MLSTHRIKYWLTTPSFFYLFLFVAFFYNLWAVPLFDLDEGAFAEATREMLASGNFAATYLDGVPRYDKPILSYWLQALSVSLFGLTEFAVRFPSAIAAVCWVMAIKRVTSEEFDRKTGMFAGLFMISALWIGLIGRAAIADAWLNLFISLTMFSIWRYWRTGQRKEVLYAFLWMGLGALTKGPVALAIPFITSGIFFILNGAWKDWLRAIVNPLGWLILLSVLTPWLYLVYQDQGIGFFHGFLVEHNLNRFQSTREGHGGSWYYFLLVLPLIILPYSGPLFGIVKRLATMLANPFYQFLLIWFTLVFVLVSYSQTQLPHYVLYGVSGLFIIFACERRYLFRSAFNFVFPLAFWLLMIILPNLLQQLVMTSMPVYEQALVKLAVQEIDLSFSVYALVGLLASLLSINLRKLPKYYRMLLLGLWQTLFVYFVLLPAAGAVQQQPIKNAALFASQFPEQRIVSFQTKLPSFSVYRQQITPREAPQVGDWVFVKVDRYAVLQREFGAENLQVKYAEGGVMIVAIISE